MAAGGLAGCRSFSMADTVPGYLEVRSPDFFDVIAPTAELETLSVGYRWSEGPTWDRARGALYFTDVPENTAYRWRPGAGVDVFLQPSGASATEGFREPGANGLWFARDGHLLICNHGLRRVERMNLETSQRKALAQTFEGHRFNSPNDVVEARDGTLYFTDPPYGLEGLDASPLKEMAENGVYRLTPGGQISRLVSDMTFPNGVALSPDETQLYVSQSDPGAPIIRALDLSSQGEVQGDATFFDGMALLSEGLPGLPDGMAVSAQGHIFATGPGGVLVLSPEGDLLGRILTGRATANCAFGEDGSVLFITAGDRLMRLQTRVSGVQWN